MVEYTNDFKFAFYDGYRFTRDDKTGYYLSGKKTDIGRQERLHSYVWRKHNGALPKGFHVHHKDGDKRNNELENLVLVDKKKHMIIHGESLSVQDIELRRINLAKNARPKAAEWHRSEEGRKWHKEHGIKAMEAREPVPLVCEQCGKPFKSKQPRARFCCNACKSQWRRDARIDSIVCECVICGTKFSTDKYSKSQTCSASCANKLRWASRRKKVICAV